VLGSTIGSSPSTGSPNGNGRMSRAAADLVVAALGAAPFTWGRQSAKEPSVARSRHLDALRAAGHHDLAPLAAFVLS